MDITHSLTIRTTIGPLEGRVCCRVNPTPFPSSDCAGNRVVTDAVVVCSLQVINVNVS